MSGETGQEETGTKKNTLKYMTSTLMGFRIRAIQ